MDCGFFGGIAIWGRIHVALIVALVGLLLGYKRRDVGVVIRVGLGSGALLALESVWTKALYGSWNPTSIYGLAVGDNPFATDGNQLVNQLGLWFSLDRGLLIWSPVVVFFCRRWRVAGDGSPTGAQALVWGGLAYTFVKGYGTVLGAATAFTVTG